MNLSEAKEIVAEAVKNNATKLNLNANQYGFEIPNNNEKLSDSDIAELLPEILKLKNLKVLNLFGNQLTVLDKEFAKLLNLQELILGSNQLSILDKEFAKLKNLKALSLTRNRLITLDKEFANLENLQTLALGGNQITVFDREFAKLRNLRNLHLWDNRLTRFDKEFVKLKRLEILQLQRNPLPFPEEILEDEKNPQRILNFIVEYYEAQEKGTLRPLNEAKLVVVGEANVGKTCVINRLINDEFIETSSTHGIEIHHWKNVELEDTQKVQLNVWDFGGQEIMHSTHQFFFTKRTVYVLVINARENEDTNKTEEWLQRIQNLSQNSPVFIVGNKIDENNRGTDRTSLGYFDIERKRLLEKFPNLIKGFYGVSSDVGKNQFDFLFEDFKRALISEIGKLGEIHKEFPANWFEIKAQLEEMQAKKVPYITFRDYLRRCIKAEIENEESQRTLIDFMHDLGIALSFQDDKELRDLAVLNPEWVTRGVYALIDNAQITLEKGILKREDIGKYLDEKEYPPETQDFIIKMMRKFQLLIDIQKDEVFLIPDLLPKDETDTGNWDETLHFQYSYDIYEKSILRRFMVGMFHLRSKETYWRNGIVLKKGNNRALVKADVQDKTISIKIDGNQNTRREFIAIIRSEFDKIHASFDGLNFKEMLGHPKYPHVLRDYFRLRSMEDDGIEKEYVEELRTSLSVKDWLNGFDSVEERRKRDRERESNNIYIYGDNNKVIQGVNDSQITIQERVIDEIARGINDAQKQTMEKLADEIIARIEAKELPKLNEEEQDELEKVKKGKWETKLKFVIPLIPKIPFLGEFFPSASMETTRTITADEYISTVRKRLYDDLQSNILQDKSETKRQLSE